MQLARALHTSHCQAKLVSKIHKEVKKNANAAGINTVIMDTSTVDVLLKKKLPFQQKHASKTLC